MDDRITEKAAILEVFHILGLDDESTRERYRRLATLDRLQGEPIMSTYEHIDTRHNTAVEEDYAQLEPTS